jgi:hypothetical protein
MKLSPEFRHGFLAGLAAPAGLYAAQQTICPASRAESGTPPKPTSQSPRRYFVIAGVVVHEDQWHEMSRELRQLRARANFRVFGEIKWRYFGGQNDGRDNKLAHLAQGDKDKFRKLLLEILTVRKSVKIVACVTHVKGLIRLSMSRIKTTCISTPVNPFWNAFYTTFRM